MTSWYFFSLAKKRNDIADTAWGIGFIVLSLFCLALNPTLKQLISFILILIWGSRLSIHIYQRNKNKSEDYRYQQFKKNTYVKVFIFQGFLLWLISFSFIFSKSEFYWFNFLGIFVWIFGFTFESIADAQLKKFIKNPKNKGKIMQSGLWAYSRHPNYFGEVSMWWGIWLLNLNFAQNWWTIIGPITITYLITQVSGIPLLENKMSQNPEFKKYQSQVSVFIPWFSKKTN
jgi:steroid 5-alpha reductase family enzyme